MSASGYFGQQYFAFYHPPVNTGVTGSGGLEFPCLELNGAGSVPSQGTGSPITITVVRATVRGVGGLVVPMLAIRGQGRVKPKVRGQGRWVAPAMRGFGDGDIGYIGVEDEELLALDAAGVL